MTKLSIAKRTPVENIRSVWPKEPDFSDWLTTQEGIELIAQDLEVEIENPRREEKGSNFSCDVVANLVGDEKHIVVIENQYGRTNHDHLAKLLTYAATHKAMTGIWIAEEVADDHRQVIDWLNENTPDTVALYLAELKAYTIEASAAAPMLDLVCRPNVTMKQTNAGLTEGDRKRREWRIAFWQEIHHRLKGEKIPFRLQKPGPDHWSSIAIGRSGFHVSMLLTPKNQSVVLEMIVQPAGWKDSAFEQLQLEAQEIDAAVGKPLQWRQMPDKTCSKIVLEEKLDPDIEGNRKKICDWFAEWTPKVYLAFHDRVKKLVAPEDA
jgi:hypothetical protein